jgi:NAD-dependent SIR2 family protein deacetylase
MTQQYYWECINCDGTEPEATWSRHDRKWPHCSNCGCKMALEEGMIVDA